MNALLTVKEPDGLPVGMICYVASAPDGFHIRPGELVRVLNEAHTDSISWNEDLKAPIDPPVPAYKHNVERLLPHVRPDRYVEGFSSYWCHVNMLRPATQQEIEEAGL